VREDWNNNKIEDLDNTDRDNLEDIETRNQDEPTNQISIQKRANEWNSENRLDIEEDRVNNNNITIIRSGKIRRLYDYSCCFSLIGTFLQ